MGMHSTYNPLYHANVTRNFRRMYKEKYQVDTPLTDERIWWCFEEWYGIVNDDGDDAGDEFALEGMREESIEMIAAALNKLKEQFAEPLDRSDVKAVAEFDQLLAEVRDVPGLKEELKREGFDIDSMLDTTETTE